MKALRETQGRDSQLTFSSSPNKWDSAELGRPRSLIDGSLLLDRCSNYFHRSLAALLILVVLLSRLHRFNHVLAPERQAGRGEWRAAEIGEGSQQLVEAL